MIEIQGLQKKYGKKEILRHVSLVLPDKGLVILQGPSGCGKSTFLNVLTGIERAQSGTVSYDGRNFDLSKNDLARFRQKEIGIIFQDYLINEKRTVEENLQEVGAIFEIPLPGFKDILAALGLESLRKRQASHLSAGEKQRLGIARALLKNPSYVFADEPTGNLDEKTARAVFDILKSISTSRLVFVVTHDESLAKEYADLLLSFEDGEIRRRKEKTSSTVSALLNPFPIAKGQAGEAPLSPFLPRKARQSIVSFILAFLAAFSASLLLRVGFLYRDSRVSEVFSATYHQDSTSVLSPIGSFQSLLPASQEQILDAKEESGIYDFGNLLFQFGDDVQILSKRGEQPMGSQTSVSFRMVDIDMPYRNTYGEIEGLASLAADEVLISQRLATSLTAVYPNFLAEGTEDYFLQLRDNKGSMQSYGIQGIVPIEDQNLLFLHNGGDYYDLFNRYIRNEPGRSPFLKQFSRLMTDATIRPGDKVAVSTGLLNCLDDSQVTPFLSFLRKAFNYTFSALPELNQTEIAVVEDTDSYFLFPAEDTALGRARRLNFVNYLVFVAGLPFSTTAPNPAYLKDYAEDIVVTSFDVPIPFSRHSEDTSPPEAPDYKTTRILLRKDVYDLVLNLCDGDLASFIECVVKEGDFILNLKDVDCIGYYEGTAPLLLIEGNWREHLFEADSIPVRLYDEEGAENPLVPLVDDHEKANAYLQGTDISIQLTSCEDYVRQSFPNRLSIDFFILLSLALFVLFLLLLLLWTMIVLLSEKKDIGRNLCLGLPKKGVTTHIVSKNNPLPFLVLYLIGIALSSLLSIGWNLPLAVMLPAIGIVSYTLIVLAFLALCLCRSPRRLL